MLIVDKMEASLAAHAWLVGDRYSLADIAVAPFVKRMEEEIIPDEMSERKHQRVHGWWRKIQARPAFTRRASRPSPPRWGSAPRWSFLNHTHADDLPLHFSFCRVTFWRETSRTR
jgi:hypothetical protein